MAAKKLGDGINWLQLGVAGSHASVMGLTSDSKAVISTFCDMMPLEKAHEVAKILAQLHTELKTAYDVAEGQLDIVKAAGFLDGAIQKITTQTHHIYQAEALVAAQALITLNEPVPSKRHYTNP